jgi:hypothetical protein
MGAVLRGAFGVMSDYVPLAYMGASFSTMATSGNKRIQLDRRPRDQTRYVLISPMPNSSVTAPCTTMFLDQIMHGPLRAFIRPMLLILYAAVRKLENVTRSSSR